MFLLVASLQRGGTARPRPRPLTDDRRAYLSSRRPASGGIGFLVGLVVKAGAGPRESAQATGNLIIEGALAGLLIGLSAGPLYGLLVGWTGG